MNDPSNILVAVEAEINVLERRLAKLREIKRLAVELDGARLPTASVSTASKHPSMGGKQRPKSSRSKVTSDRSKIPARLTPEDMIDTARDLLADGPVTSAEIHRALDRWPTARTRAIVDDVLQQLGAVQVGVAKGGTPRWALPADTSEVVRDSEPSPSTVVREALPPGAALDRHELEIRVSELEHKLGEWSPEEWQYQLHRRFRLQVPMAELRDVLGAMTEAAA